MAPIIKPIFSLIDPPEPPRIPEPPDEPEPEPPPAPRVIVKKPDVPKPKPQAPVVQKPQEERRRIDREGSGAGASADRTRGLLSPRGRRTMLA